MQKEVQSCPLTKKRKVREFSRKCQHVCSFEGANLQMAQWLSWLERRPVTAEVESSSHFRVVSIKLMMFSKVHKVWDLSSAGRASALQAEGHRFEPCRPHLLNKDGFPSGQRGQTVNLLATRRGR